MGYDFNSKFRKFIIVEISNSTTTPTTFKGKSEGIEIYSNKITNYLHKSKKGQGNSIWLPCRKHMECQEKDFKTSYFEVSWKT